MSTPNLKDMLEAGVHFGHQTLRWNPKMQPYILTERNGVHILDLAKTQKGLDKAVEAIKQIVNSGKKVLFVGTKKSVRHCIEDAAKKSGSHYVTNRWLGGMLTNFATVKQSIAKLENIEKMESEGLYKELKKKQVGDLQKEQKKLESVLGGIRSMKQNPGAVFIVDTNHEHIALKEARRLGVPTFAIVDSNSNPDNIDFPIPGNDDAIKSVSLLLSAITDTIVAEGKAQQERVESAQKEKDAAIAKAEQATEAKEEASTK
jgi:small subunit ribosomal protein S2